MGSKKLIEQVLRGKNPRELVEFFVDNPTQASLPISQFMQDMIDANEQLKQLRSDLDQLSADMVNFEQSTQIPDFAKAKGTLTWLNNTSDTMATRLNEVIAWTRQHIQKLGN